MIVFPLLCSFALVAFLTPNWTAAAPFSNHSGGRFDYIIVGGGPAGFVVAEYLTRTPNVSVILLDAGPDLGTDADINSESTLT